jgi:hypothetical protein
VPWDRTMDEASPILSDDRRLVRNSSHRKEQAFSRTRGTYQELSIFQVSQAREETQFQTRSEYNAEIKAGRKIIYVFRIESFF